MTTSDGEAVLDPEELPLDEPDEPEGESKEQPEGQFKDDPGVSLK